MKHELPHGAFVHDVVGKKTGVPVKLKIPALEVDQLGRIDAGDGVQIKMADSCPPHKVPEYPAVLPFTAADTVPSGVVSQRQGLKFPDHSDSLVIGLAADGWLVRLPKG